MKLPRTTYAIFLVGALLWCGLILLAPYLAASLSPFCVFVYQGFHHICHQQPERSFHLFGEKLAVCSRCTSIYFAFLFGVLIFPLFRYSKTPSLQHSNAPTRGVLIAAMLPMLIDVGLDFIGIHESTFVTRTITGIIFGSVIPLFVLPAAIEGVQQIASSKQITFTET